MELFGGVGDVLFRQQRLRVHQTLPHLAVGGVQPAQLLQDHAQLPRQDLVFDFYWRRFGSLGQLEPGHRVRLFPVRVGVRPQLRLAVGEGALIVVFAGA